MTAEKLAQARIQRHVAATQNFSGVAYVEARDRAVARFLALLYAYEMGQASHVAQLLEESQELGRELMQLDGGQLLWPCRV